MNCPECGSPETYPVYWQRRRCDDCDRLFTAVTEELETETTLEQHAQEH